MQSVELAIKEFLNVFLKDAVIVVSIRLKKKLCEEATLHRQGQVFTSCSILQAWFMPQLLYCHKYINHKPYWVFKSQKLQKTVYINKGEHIGNKPTKNSDFDEQEF